MGEFATEAPLRDLLGAVPDPEFELTMPPGWERSSPTQGVEAGFEQRMSRAFMEIGSPEAMTAFARLRAELRSSMETMRRERVVAFFAPTKDVGRWVVPFPASIIATIRSMPTTQDMDGYVKSLIVRDGARPLGANRGVLRRESEHVEKTGDEQIVVRSILYVAPVPGTGRRRALELLAVFGRPEEAAPDDADVDAVTALLDGIVSTLRWHRPSGSGVARGARR
ncbi:hypothetical protein [Microbacterium sp. ZXX196]|uniref:hypothetical protein n=1 Tax=Microbacterium sp. ZXX196 TaxID=2609291 RepID=UPI0012B893BC|nr:hypothetical protein [Microbacterium sp. ZXX196]MTE24460.1 hypothetical protein [Microbacterium sp. ZXX196]